MRKVFILLLAFIFILTACENNSTESTFKFGEDLSFVDKDGTYIIDLANSSATVQEKHKQLAAIINEKSILTDIVAITATTANILEQAGIKPTGAPESPSLDQKLVEMQYSLRDGQKIDKSKILNIGSAIAPNIEAIVELDPRLVLYSDAMPKSDFMKNIEAGGVKVEALGQSDYLDMFILLDVINNLTDYENEQATSLMNDMVNHLKTTNEIVAQTSSEKKTVAILQVAEGSVRIDNDNTVLGGIVHALNVENVFATAENSEVNKEHLLALDPDYIIYYSHGMGTDTVENFAKELTDDNSVYRELAAVKAGNAFPVATDDFTFSSSVDFNIIKTIKFLAEKIYE